MGEYEDRLKSIVSGGRWTHPGISAAQEAFSALRDAMADLQALEGWEGLAGDALRETAASLKEEFAQLEKAAHKVERIVNAGNASLEWVRTELDNLPSDWVPDWFQDRVQEAAEAGEAYVATGRASGEAVAVSHAVSAFQSLLGESRDSRAREVYEEFQGDIARLNELYPDFTSPQGKGTRIDPDPVDPIEAIEYSITSRMAGPRAPGGGDVVGPPGSVHPNPGIGGPEFPPGYPPVPHPDPTPNPNPYPYPDPTPQPHPSPDPTPDDDGRDSGTVSNDDGSTGYVPWDGSTGGPAGSTAGSDGSGAHRGLAAGLVGGGAALGAVGLRASVTGAPVFGPGMGAGAGMGAGTGAGMGARGTAAGAPGTGSGGILGRTGAAAGANTAAGSGSGATGRGLMGGMGGAAQGAQDKKRSSARGLGGPVAPVLEDEDDIAPLSQAAGSGGRGQPAADDAG